MVIILTSRKLLHNILTTDVVTVNLNDIVIISIIMIITLTIYRDIKFLVSPIPKVHKAYYNDRIHGGWCDIDMFIISHIPQKIGSFKVEKYYNQCITELQKISQTPSTPVMFITYSWNIVAQNSETSKLLCNMVWCLTFLKSPTGWHSYSSHSQTKFEWTAEGNMRHHILHSIQGCMHTHTCTHTRTLTRTHTRIHVHTYTHTHNRDDYKTLWTLMIMPNTI